MTPAEASSGSLSEMQNLRPRNRLAFSTRSSGDSYAHQSLRSTVRDDFLRVGSKGLGFPEFIDNGIGLNGGP